ncbi:AAA family ATPase [Actinocrispum wychmicini]|uniref:Regulatory LuxR family protein n=1 Tax=Actinocrispum wychmicini TaxID=1213861 RepID=A0A4R2JHS4_9PSEU|nr:LuxR family transcriptional regulator [Actinocrispum wychmicini]TCO53675.1 regulatory LuxR family protein [Actinocrispum wychmicini]
MMTLVERNDAWSALDRLMRESAAGHGRVALVTGGLATGKTELLRVFADHAAEAGALVLSAAGSRAEQSLQMGVLGQILHSSAFADVPVPLMSTVDELPWAEIDPDPAVVGPLDAPIVRDMCAAIMHVAKQRQIVMAIDDVQFVDSASLRVLLYLRRRMTSAPVMLVLAGWEQRRRSWPSFRAEMTRQPHEQIRLTALSVQGVEQMVLGRVDSPAAAQLAALCNELSGGNPLLVDALVDDFRSTPGQEPKPGIVYAQAVLTCLHRGDPQLLDVASAVAVLGVLGTPALVAKLVGESTDEIVPVFEVLTAAGVLGPHGFRHPTAARVVLDSLRAGERSRMHLSAANMLHQLGAGALDIARHLLAADAACGPWAVELLREASERALADDDVEAAAHCLRLALRDCASDEARFAITKALARVEWRVNPAAAALHLGPLQKAMHEGTLTSRDAATLARHALWQGDTETVLAALSQASDPQIAAELRLVFEWMYGSQQALPAGDRAGTPGNPWVQVASKLSGLMVKGRAEEVAGSAEHILQSCHLGDTTLEVIVSALFALAYADKPDKAAFWCETLADEAERRNAPTWQALLGAVRADIALRQGDLAFAQSQAVAALALLPAEGWGVLIGLPRATLLSAYTGMGQQDAAADVLKQFVPDQMFRTVIGLRYLHARGHYYLGTERALAALDDFQTCDRQMREWNIDVPALVPALTDLAQAYLQLDQHKLARDLVTRQLERSRTTSSRTRGVSLRVLAATTELRQRPHLLMEAIEDLHNSGDRLELARALIDLSEAHQELGEFSRARMHARRAAAEAKACHAEPMSRLLSHSGSFEVKETKMDAEGVPPLSGAERRVATLAARGYSNREIGRMLYITVSTVEQHLTRVYRKLNVGSRADLPVGLLLSRVPVTGAQQDTMSSFE